MDAKLKKIIQDLQEKRKDSDCPAEYMELEGCLREFETELKLKRDEVKQLHRDLDSTNKEMQNLKTTFDKTKKSLDECQFNLNLQLQKARNDEAELLEKRETLMKIQLQQKMATTEVDLLKENLQKAEIEKVAFLKKLNAIENKQRYSSVYDNEILQKNIQITNFMTNLKEMIPKFQGEHSQVIDLLQKNELVHSSIEKMKICIGENERLKKEMEYYKDMYIKVNAKYEKLEDLMAMDPSMTDPNFITKLIFNQWKKNRSHCDEERKQRNKILDIMSESLTMEKDMNCKLIKENKELKDINKKLEEKNITSQELCREALKYIQVPEENKKSE